MRTFTIQILGVVRYLRPGRNPLRRPIDRVHTRVIAVLGALFLLLSPLVVTATAHVVGAAGLRAERLQAHARHRADATVVGTSPAATSAGFNDTTWIRWRDAARVAHTAAVPTGGDDRAGAHRSIWIGPTGRLTTHPHTHAQTIADTVMAVFIALTVLALLHSATYTLIDRRLDRRRLDLWEREWAAVAPRWTGLP